MSFDAPLHCSHVPISYFGSRLAMAELPGMPYSATTDRIEPQEPLPE